LKSGGYKISALEIEAAIMHAMGEDRVAEAIVLGREHPRWGDESVAVVRLKKKTQGPLPLTLTLEEMQSMLAPHLTSYKLPRALIVVEEVPKNALEKVVKKTLLKDLGVSSAGGQ
jgi:malonyl-CoA/methylmalonyl-CoA synthetase